MGVMERVTPFDHRQPSSGIQLGAVKRWLQKTVDSLGGTSDEPGLGRSITRYKPRDHSGSYLDSR